VDQARENSQTELRPQQEALIRNQASMQETQSEIDSLVGTITSGRVSDALLGFQNQRAGELQDAAGETAGGTTDVTSESDALAPGVRCRAFPRCVTRRCRPHAGSKTRAISANNVNAGKEDRGGPESVCRIQFNPVDTLETGKDRFDLRAWSDTPRSREVEPVFHREHGHLVATRSLSIDLANVGLAFKSAA
jgi:hypothetical protein